MMRIFLTVILVSCFVGVLLGFSVARSFLSVNAWQVEAETNPHETLAETALAQTTNPNTKAQIEETVHYFGIMNTKDNGSHDFFIRNAGTADLILIVDRTSCSCLGIDITPSRVPPGGTARCHLKYRAEQAATGKFAQGGIIRTNDPDNREIQLRVEGVFTNPVAVRPASVYVPKVIAGTTRTETIRFYGFENEPLQLAAPTWTDHEHFDFQWQVAEFTESDTMDPYYSLAKSVVEGTITIKPGLPIGTFQEWFQIRTNYPSQTHVSCLASGQIVGGNVSISGQGYNRSTGIADVGRTGMGGSLSREISIRFSGSSAPSASVQVRAVEPAWIRVELSSPRDVGPLRMFSLMITVPEDAPTGSYGLSGDGQQAYVLLETNDESMPALKIPLQFAVGKQ